MVKNMKIEDAVHQALEELKNTEEFAGKNYSEILDVLLSYHGKKENGKELQNANEELKSARLEIYDLTSEIERLEREKTAILEASPELLKDMQKAKSAEYVAEQQREAKEHTADTDKEIAQIQQSGKIICESMKSAAKEGEFIKTFGPTITELLPAFIERTNLGRPTETKSIEGAE